MARVVMTILGAILLAVGIWLCVQWWSAVSVLLMAVVALGLVLLGLIIFVLGISEISGARRPKTPGE